MTKKPVYDTHIHIFDKDYPIAPTAYYQPPDASVYDYRSATQNLGITDAIVVQPTTYGSDNRCTLQAVQAFGGASRAVVVVEETITDRELEELHAAGARGIRFHMLEGAVLGWDALPRLSARIKDLGWHVQVQLDGLGLPEVEPMLSRLESNLVIDHLGRFSSPVHVDHPAYQSLLRLAEHDHVYVKLSGCYLTSRAGPPRYADYEPLARKLIAAAPERLLWASDWPFPVAASGLELSIRGMLELLNSWVTSSDILQKILSDNPYRLYR